MVGVEVGGGMDGERSLRRGSREKTLTREGSAPLPARLQIPICLQAPRGRAAVSHWQELFKAYDLDESGELTRDEYLGIEMRLSFEEGKVFKDIAPFLLCSSSASLSPSAFSVAVLAQGILA